MSETPSINPKKYKWTDPASALRELASRVDDGRYGLPDPISPIVQKVVSYLEFHKSPEYASVFWRKIEDYVVAKREILASASYQRGDQDALRLHQMRRGIMEDYLLDLASEFVGNGRTGQKTKKRRRSTKRTIPTVREKEAAELRSRGYTHSEIAHEMGISKARAGQLLVSEAKRKGPSSRSANLRKAGSVHVNTSTDEKPAQRTARQRKGN